MEFPSLLDIYFSPVCLRTDEADGVFGDEDDDDDDTMSKKIRRRRSEEEEDRIFTC